MIDPPDDVCYVVHIPNDKAYRQAFWQSYEYLTRWVAWKRDPNHLATLAAQRMKQSLVRTWETLDTYGDLCELEINVNCGGACCTVPMTIQLIVDVHISGDQIDEIIAMPPGAADDGVNPPSGWTGTYEEYIDYKCRQVSQQVDDFEETFANLSAFGAFIALLSGSAAQAAVTPAAISAIARGSIALGLSVSGGLAVVIGILIFMVFAGLYMFSYFQRVLAEINFDDLKCALYLAGDAAEAQANFRQVVEDAWLEALLDQETGGSLFLTKMLEIVDVLVPLEWFETVFHLFSGAPASTTFDCAASCQLPPPAGALLTDLEAYWTMDEASGDRLDSVGSLDLTPVAGAAQVAGVVNGAGNCIRTSSQYFQNTNTGATFTWGDHEWTVGCWFRPASINMAVGEWRTFVWCADAIGNLDSVQFGLSIQNQAGTVKCLAWQGTNNVAVAKTVYSSAAIPDDEWRFVLAWHDPAADLIYIQIDDGAIVPAATAGLYPTSAGIRRGLIGTDYVNNNPSRFFDGAVDEVAVWSRILTADERTWLYNAGAGRTYADF